MRIHRDAVATETDVLRMTDAVSVEKFDGKSGLTVEVRGKAGGAKSGQRVHFVPKEGRGEVLAEMYANAAADSAGQSVGEPDVYDTFVDGPSTLGAAVDHRPPRAFDVQPSPEHDPCA